MPVTPTFLFGDRTARPSKTCNSLQHILRDVFTAQGLIGFGICLQALCSYFIPQPYTFAPGLLIVAASSIPTLLNALGLRRQPEDTTIVVGKTAAYLGFANPDNAGKQPGSPAFVDAEKPAPQPFALMLIGSRCFSKLGSLQPEFKEMGDVINAMIDELRAAPPEHDVGFLNSEYYTHGAQPSGNSNMMCIYWKSYEHIHRFAHKVNGDHYPAWQKYMTLQRERSKLGSQIGIWHEIFDVSNAEGIYWHMPRMGLGDLWDAVPTADGRVVYRNSLVTGTGTYASSKGRMGVPESSGKA
ncbi:hypothetical protein BU17DRAFT_79398 [Hysterangium stoloniferum]|nr:hypothetical protein BU17DRAFT_79398 [Hysterangium stoloniferum]